MKDSPAGKVTLSRDLGYFGDRITQVPEPIWSDATDNSSCTSTPPGIK